MTRINFALFLFIYITLVSTKTYSSSFFIKKDFENPIGHSIENNYVKILFVPSIVNKQKSYLPKFYLKINGKWYLQNSNEQKESYIVLHALENTKLSFYKRGYPKWEKINSSKKSEYTKVIWEAAKNFKFIVKEIHRIDSTKLKLEFYENKIGKLEAFWNLKPNEKTASISLSFTSDQEGQFSLGYFLPKSKNIESVDALLMPMLVQQKRFPEENYTQLQASAPTPLSIMQITENQKSTVTWGLSGDPSLVPFEFPVPIKSHYGLHIKNKVGEVQPSIFGPVLGTEKSNYKPNDKLTFSFKIFVQKGDWYDTYRNIADNVFGLKDYRKNGNISMTQSIYNMIDLYMDDHYGGWWTKAKANYQIESKNGSTQSSPLTTVSLYRLTNNDSLYFKRTLPSLEYVLSRDNPHFSPYPNNTGTYNKGSMNGPVDIFGTTVYGGLWAMMNYKTPIFRDIALPNGEINLTKTQQNFEPHIQPFDELVGKYLINCDEKVLEQAINEADEYIAKVINVQKEKNISPREFFLMSFTDDWEGLLKLYEITKYERFLNAAVKAAKITMTGMWTQPMPKDEQVVIHENNYVHGDKMDRWLHKGEEEFRLGYPRKEGDITEKKVPAWLVSNVGLGFEQPTTYTYKNNGGRMILQSNWTSGFLRLAHYSGDKTFEMYARNAALGRGGNYAGYYYTTFSDLQQNPLYPYKGPDIGFIYYHHLPVHISWNIDYLVSAATLASSGKVKFPGLRQFGYAYFDNLVYGHKPGKIYDTNDVWLWFNKNLVSIDNNQINYLTAHSKDKFYLILMNASNDEQKLKVHFNKEAITKSRKKLYTANALEASKTIIINNEQVEIDLAPRGFEILEITDLDIYVKTHKEYPKQLINKSTYKQKIPLNNKTEINATVIQVLPENWTAYIYSNANFKEYKKIEINWKTTNRKGSITDYDYPYEFSIQLKKEEKKLNFKIIAETSAGKIEEVESLLKIN